MKLLKGIGYVICVLLFIALIGFIVFATSAIINGLTFEAQLEAWKTALGLIN